MALLRIVVENTHYYKDIIHIVVRTGLIPLTLTNLLNSWAVEDTGDVLLAFLWVVKELLHIVPCVLGQMGLMYYEPIEKLRRERIEAVSREKTYYGKLNKEITILFNMAIKIVNDHSREMHQTLIVHLNSRLKRAQELLNLWNLTRQTEKQLLHYPKCFLLVTFNSMFGLNSKDKEPNEEQVKPTRRVKRKIVGAKDLPSTKLTSIILKDDTDFALEDTFIKSKSPEAIVTLENVYEEQKQMLSSTSLPSSFHYGHKSNGEGQSFQTALKEKLCKDLNKSATCRVDFKYPKAVETDSKQSKKPRNSDDPFYDKVRKAIVTTMQKKGFDDGSLGPVMVRLCWHCCATYDKATGTGGSNGATIRFEPESSDTGNTGLITAITALEKVKQQFPKVTYADLYTLAGVTAIEAMGGPKIEWRPGRMDCTDDRYVPPNGRLPIGSKDSEHIREVFYRMGFNDQEIVCLMGTHTLGRTHNYYSGWEGKWTDEPTRFDNEFYKLLLNDKWEVGHVPETGNRQYYNSRDHAMMMLQTDMEMKFNPDFLKWVKIYAKDKDRYFEDYSKVFAKLLELGLERNEDGIAIKKR